jgi:hypothetical protein
MWPMRTTTKTTTRKTTKRARTKKISTSTMMMTPRRKRTGTSDA